MPKSTTTEAKEVKVRIHPAAVSWNEFVKAMEVTRLLWEQHKETYLRTKGTIGEYSRETQVHLSGIMHRQKFEFVLDYMVKYSNTGYLPLMIKEEEAK